jgi:LmbE family N-acetylglucosaminyl deacetylase
MTKQDPIQTLIKPSIKNVVLIVAHPDDETLWAGGTVLDNPEWNCFVVCLCRKNDPDRSVKFYKVLELLNATGIMGDLDDGPEQCPLSDSTVDQAILDLVPERDFDLIITHSPFGEYTRLRRHEEIGSAVIRLWISQALSTKALWHFSFEDKGGTYLPRAIKGRESYRELSESTWLKKYQIMTTHYGFSPASWEARTTPRAEAFKQFDNPSDAKPWLMKKIRESK